MGNTRLKVGNPTPNVVNKIEASTHFNKDILIDLLS